MQIGDKMRKTFKFDDVKRDRVCQSKTRTLTGKVIYIHPLHRFYVLEFKVPGGKFRQSFRFKEAAA